MWRTFIERSDAGPRYATRTYDVFSFGDSPEMADELAQLVLAGTKTATASLRDDEPISSVGDVSVVTDGQDLPICIIETVEVLILPFGAVIEGMAREEGEGDGSLESWRHGHWAFFAKECEELGKEMSQETSIVFERFRLLYPEGQIRLG